MNRDLELFKNSAILENVTESFRDLLFQMAKVQTVRRGEILYSETVPQDQIYFIVEGNVQTLMTVDPKAAGQEREPGSFLGLITFIQGGSTPALMTATALTDLRCLVWNASDWHDLCQKYPADGYSLVLAVARLFVGRVERSHLGLLSSVSWGIE